MKTEIIKLTVSLMAAAAFINGASKAQAQAMYSMPSLIDISISNSMVREAEEAYADKWENESPPKPTRKPRPKVAVTPNRAMAFTPDADIARQVKSTFVNQSTSAEQKKFLDALLTPDNVNKIFGPLTSQNLNLNNISDVLSIASLFSYSLIEDGGSITPVQMQSTRERFRTHFAKHSVDALSKEKSGIHFLYWTMLIAYFKSEQKQNGTNERDMAKLKANISKVMATLDLDPAKYRLGKNGFVLR